MSVNVKLLAALVAGVLATPMPAAMAAAPGQVTNTVNVRSGPSFHHHVFAQLPAGHIVDVSGCRNGWCLVALNGASGWIRATIVLQPGAPAGPVAAPIAATALAAAAPLAPLAPFHPVARAVAFGGPGYLGPGYYGRRPVARAYAHRGLYSRSYAQRYDLGQIR